MRGMLWDRSLSLSDLGREVVAGLAASTLQIGLSISLAFIVFAGPFEAFLPRGIGLAVIGAGLAAAFLGLQTRIPGAIGSQQDTPAVVLAAAAAGLSGVDASQAEDTIFAFVMIVGLLTGISFVVVGRFGLATAVRSLPFPVISGFLAGTGWILARAGIEIMVGERLRWVDLGGLWAWDQLRLWLPGLLLAIVVTFFSSRGGRSMLFPGALIAILLGVHAVGRIGWSLDALRDNGWLLGPFPDAGSWSPVGVSELVGADWAAIAGQAIPALGVVGVALISMMLNVAGLEVQLGEDVEVENESTRAGISAVLVSALSGYPAYHLISGTVMARSIGSRTPIAAITIFAACVGVVLAGIDVVALIPRAVVGGVLLTVGLSMLVDWVGQVRSRLNLVDGMLSLVILGSIIAFGVLAGIGVGLLAAVIGFAISYSRIDPVREVHRLDTSHSAVDRLAFQREILGQHNDEVVAIELTGFLFFGSVRRVAELVTPMIESGKLTNLVLDLTGVRGFDVSVVQGFQNLQRKADRSGVELHWAGLDDASVSSLRRGGIRVNDYELDLDHALELMEDRILHEHKNEEEKEDLTMLTMLEEHCERLTLAPGTVLMDPSDASGGDLYIVETGFLTAWGATDDGERVRFRRFGRGSVIGEVGFLAGTKRTATVTADDRCVVMRLSSSTWESLRRDEPDFVFAAQTALTARVAERLAHTSAAYRRLVRS